LRYQSKTRADFRADWEGSGVRVKFSYGSKVYDATGTVVDDTNGYLTIGECRKPHEIPRQNIVKIEEV